MFTPKTNILYSNVYDWTGGLSAAAMFSVVEAMWSVAEAMWSNAEAM